MPYLDQQTAVRTPFLLHLIAPIISCAQWLALLNPPKRSCNRHRRLCLAGHANSAHEQVCGELLISSRHAAGARQQQYRRR